MCLRYWLNERLFSTHNWIHHIAAQSCDMHCIACKRATTQRNARRRRSIASECTHFNLENIVYVRNSSNAQAVAGWRLVVRYTRGVKSSRLSILRIQYERQHGAPCAKCTICINTCLLRTHANEANERFDTINKYIQMAGERLECEGYRNHHLRACTLRTRHTDPDAHASGACFACAKHIRRTLLCMYVCVCVCVRANVHLCK